jgi:RNA polymerase sigma factor (sigma-70 family)
MTLNKAYEEYRCAHEAGTPVNGHIEVLYSVLKQRATCATYSNPAKTDEWPHEIATHIILNLSGYDSTRSSFATWVDRIVTNFCRRHGKEDANDPEIFIEDLSPSELAGLADVDADPETKILLDDIYRHLVPEEQTLLRMKLEGYDSSEISTALGVPEGTVRRKWYELKPVIKAILGVKK